MDFYLHKVTSKRHDDPCIVIVTEMSEGLPKWLANPLIISSSTTTSAEIDPSDSELFDALGIEGLFPFQAFVRDRLRSKHPEGDRDLCVSAPTGSGKTLAYVLPIVEKLRDRVVGRLRALVVVPSRDLIPQVEDTFRVVCEAYGCADRLKNGIDYLVTTPGKLISTLFSREYGSEFKDLKYLVVDEADRLLDQSFQEWLPQLLDTLKRGNFEEADSFDLMAWKGSHEGQVQKLLFSATLTTNPAKISPLNLYRLLYVSVRSDAFNGDGAVLMNTPESLRELMAVFDGAEEMKPAVLIEILETVLPQILGVDRVSRLLCFTKSVASTQRLSRLLSAMRPALSVAAFHGNLSDFDRTRILDHFATDQIQVLIGSDAMARGLDLKGVKCVINYDMPMFAATYVHRVGRTARAGQEGLAMTILPTSQTRSFKNLLKSDQLNKRVVNFVNAAELKVNEVGKIEIEGEMISSKWRELLVSSLQDVRIKQ